MATNYPAALDTATELGSTFSNTAAVTDPVTQIDALYRTNIKDAMLAVQARLGVTNSTVPTSLSWATLSVGGTDNQGLRFAGSNATWPGLVAENGIFLDSTSGYPQFHYAGDPAATFYPLTAVGLVVSLQNAYNTSGTITTSGADDLAFAISAGDDFTVTHAAGTHTVLSGAATTLTTGLLDINCTTIAATNVTAVNTQTTNAVNNQEFGCYLADVDNTGDLSAGEVIFGSVVDLDMGGDGPGAGRAVGAAYYARGAAFTGANNYESAGLFIRSAYDWGVLSEAPLKVETALNAQSLLIDSDPAAAAGALEIANVGTNAGSGLLACYEGTTTTPTSVRYFLDVDGTIVSTVNSASTGLTVNQAGAGGFFSCVDAGGPTTRFQIGKSGNVSVFAAAGYANAALVIDHSAATEPFIDLDGTYNATAANGNITDEDTGGAVVGPGTNTWTWSGMARVEVSSGGGSIPAGDYWVALYK